MSLRRNTVWNLAGNVIPLGAGAIAIPFLMKHMGMERFSIVTMVWTLIGYLSFFDFGLGRALTKILAQQQSAGEAKGKNLIDSAVFLTMVAGIAGGVILLGVSGILVHHALNISLPNQKDAWIGLALTGLGVPLTTVGSALRGVLEGKEKFGYSNIVKAFFGTATFLFPMLMVLGFGPSILNVTISLIASRLISIIMYLGMIRRIMPSFKPAIFRKDKESIKSLSSFGSWMTLSNVISPILTSIDRYFISGILGAAVVAYYTVPYEMIVRILIIPGSIGVTLFPRLSTMFGDDARIAHRLVSKSIRITALMLVPICLMFGFLYVPGVSLWLGKDFAAKSYWVAILLSAGALANGLSYVLYTAVQAKNGSKATGIMHLSELVAYLPILLIFIKNWGIVGAAIAWCVRATADGIILLLIYATGKKERV